MKRIFILIISYLVLVSCETASVDLNDENYVFDGRGGVRCDIDGVELKPRVVTSPGPLRAELRFESFNNDESMTLRFNNTDENDTFIAVRITVKDVNPNQEQLEGLLIELNNYNTGGLSVNNEVDFSTNLNYVGEFKVVYHNQSERILAGTFWYDAVNSQDEIKEIRNGEFDMTY